MYMHGENLEWQEYKVVIIKTIGHSACPQSCMFKFRVEASVVDKVTMTGGQVSIQPCWDNEVGDVLTI